ncbi:MAG: succinate dehydrogenase, hydrophobic membrane anchor protein [Planctomycetota bacterium]
MSDIPEGSGSLRWFLQRFSGIILAACLMTHVIVIHLTGGEVIDFKSVLVRIHSSIFWTIFYVIFLSNTLFHALNGVYEVIEDYKPPRWLKLFIKVLFWFAGIVSLYWGLFTLWEWISRQIV